MAKNSGKARWSIPTWYLFHGLAEKINPAFFKKERQKILDLYILICSNLPCPICQQHASSYLKREKFIYKVQTQEDLINFLYTMHNWVNKRLKKAEYNKSAMEMYKRIDIYKCIKLWINRFFQTYYVHNNFNSWRRNGIMKNIQTFFLTKYSVPIF
jgi:hypothetical protein|uniref:thiol oxidase n=1 Tax=viral metagenome TaxID=1070528 RepID=A0A6C0IT11_9ZZZZ